MKIVTVIDWKIQEGKSAKARDALIKLAEFCNKKWPDATFSVLGPRSGHFGRVLWIEEQPSLAAKEQWEENRGKEPGLNELFSEFSKYAIWGETTVSDFQRLV